MLGAEADGLLKAIIKLRPATGIVVLSPEGGDDLSRAEQDVVLVPQNSEAESILEALLRAKELSAQRGKNQA